MRVCGIGSVGCAAVGQVELADKATDFSTSSLSSYLDAGTAAALAATFPVREPIWHVDRRTHRPLSVLSIGNCQKVHSLLMDVELMTPAKSSHSAPAWCSLDDIISTSHWRCLQVNSYKPFRFPERPVLRADPRPALRVANQWQILETENEVKLKIDSLYFDWNSPSSSSCCSRGWSRPLLAFGLIKSLPLNQIISRQWHNQETEYRKHYSSSDDQFFPWNCSMLETVLRHPEDHSTC